MALMPLMAISRLRQRLEDARRLVEIHEECTGGGRGRRHGYDALNRSTVVLAVAAWEGFVEDALDGVVGRIARYATGPSTLPGNVRDSMLAHLHEAKGWAKLNKTTKDSVWELAGLGWRKIYIQYAKEQIDALHTPDCKNIQKLASKVIGLPDFAAGWGTRRTNGGAYKQRLDDLLSLRHRIAHGSIGHETVGKTKARDAISNIERVAGWTDKAMKDHLKSLKLSYRRRS